MSYRRVTLGRGYIKKEIRCEKCGLRFEHFTMKKTSTKKICPDCDRKRNNEHNRKIYISKKAAK